MKQKAKKSRLQARIRDYEMTMSRRSDTGAQRRKESGGYRCPGSTRR